MGSRRLFGWVALIALLSSAGSMAVGEEYDVSGTRRGPTGFYLTQAERESLRERVKNEAWAKKMFEEEILAVAESGDQADALKAGLAYVVTGEKEYARFAADWLLYSANLLQAKVKQRRPGGTTIRYGPSRSNPLGYINMERVSLYDLIADALTAEEDERVRAAIKQSADTFRGFFTQPAGPGTTPNYHYINSTAGSAVGYEDYLNWALYNRKCKFGGLKYLADLITLDERIYAEPPYYGMYVYHAMGRSEPLRRYLGSDPLRSRRIYDGYITIAYPIENTGIGKGSVRVACWGDAATDRGGIVDTFVINGTHQDAARALKSFYRVTNDPKYAWFLSLLPDNRNPTKNRTFDDLIYGPVTFPENLSPPPAPSNVYPDAQRIMLRADESPNYWTSGSLALLLEGAHGMSHGHPGTLSIRLHGKGRLLYPDRQVMTYEPRESIGFDRSTVGHNTVTVDRSDASGSPAEIRHEFAPEVKFAALRCSGYPGVGQERALLMTKEYVLDVFSLRDRDPDFISPTPQVAECPDEPTIRAGRNGIKPYAVINLRRNVLPDQNFDAVFAAPAMAGVDLEQAVAYRVGRTQLASPDAISDTRGGWRWFRQTFVLPESAKEQPELYLYFAEFRMSSVKVFLNGEPLVLELDCFKKRFAVPVKDKLRFGRANELIVAANQRNWGLRADRFYGPVIAFGGPEMALSKVEQAKKHTYDWILHSYGRQFPLRWDQYKPTNELGQTSEEFSYRWFENVRKRITGDDVTVDWVQTNAGFQPRVPYWTWNFNERIWPTGSDGKIRPRWSAFGEEWYQGRVGVRMRMLGEPGSTVYLADSPLRWGAVDKDETPEEYCPVVMVRRESYDATYVALHEAYQTQPVVSDFRYIHCPRMSPDGKHLEGTPAVAVLVEGPDYTDRLYAAIGHEAERSRVSAKDQHDSRQGAVFTSYGYIRTAAKTVTARGKFASFSIYAPDVPKTGAVTLNGERITYQKMGGYVVVGLSPARITRRSKPDYKRPAPPKVALAEVSFPQEFVNISSKDGGKVVVRVTNRSGKPVSGVLRVEVGKGLAVARDAASAIGPIAPDKWVETSFRLGAAAEYAGAKVSLRAAFTPKNGEAHVAATNVAVGVVAEDIKDWWSLIQVRAPRYTFRVDKYSGVSRFIVDPDGKVRTYVDGYPFSKLRQIGGATIIPWRQYSFPHGSGFKWEVETKYLGRGDDDASGFPSASFSTIDGKVKLKYVFLPDRIEAIVIGPGKQYDFGFPTFEIKNPRYPFFRKYEKREIADGIEHVTTFGFRHEPDPAPPAPPPTTKKGPLPLRQILLNPGFEQPGDKLGLGGPFPVEWEIGYYGRGQKPPETIQSAFTLVEDVKHFGKYSLRIDLKKLRGTGKMGGAVAVVQKGFRVSKERKMAMSVWVRYENVKNTYVNEAVMVHPGVGQARPHNWGAWPHKLHDWHKWTIFRRGQSDRNGAGTFFFCLPGTDDQEGYVWLDDIELVELPEK